MELFFVFEFVVVCINEGFVDDLYVICCRDLCNNDLSGCVLEVFFMNFVLVFW